MKNERDHMEAYEKAPAPGNAEERDLGNWADNTEDVSEEAGENAVSD